jgi:antitoxin (DNA-binding transcriptional repressor) of toxin-antitoxin stability system
MKTVPATYLKNRLGEVLREAALGPVAIERHGRVVAWLTPPQDEPLSKRPSPERPFYGRAEEERLLNLCTSGDFRLSRWARAGDARTMAGVAAMLGPVEGFDHVRMLALAEQLYPGMSKPEELTRWLRETPVQPVRFLPMLKQRMRHKTREATRTSRENS